MNWLRVLVPLVPLFTLLASRWVREQQAAIFAGGEPLAGAQIDEARQAGVRHPERVRLKFVDQIPLPGGFLRELGVRTGLLSSNTAGITLGHGIYIRTAYRADRELRVHELVHVGQYERLGSIEAFLREYLRECLNPGYPWGPLEQEAILRASEIVRGR